MKAFVTGATGFVGEEILQQLHQTGHAIRILARHPQSAPVQECVSRFGAEVHIGDILNPASLPAGVRGTDAVIHLVGIISEIGKNTFENVHTLGTRNMVAAAQQAGVKRFVHMSALGTRTNAIARYHQSKWAAEEIVRNSGLDYTIFRPSIIYGPRDLFVNLFARMARFSPALPVMGSGRSKLQPVPVADVATCFVRALNEPNSIGQTYDICGGEVLSFEEVLDAILEVTGRKRWKLHLPLGIARLQAALLEFIFPRVLGKAPPLNRDQLLMLDEDNVGHPQPANDLFRLKPIPFKQGIAQYL
ncbi:MAG: NAD-dependent epimerase/dehydratase, partial [Pedosphaera sp.]|nr:NAD-dependent epimerase/dehydratase [Pedosphaera sp.]